ncbi:MAG TPA: hypothetical protein DCF33_14315 [Saprospirales bacterium]|nr:hypothetical protein [Saprospirales bacterium]
MRLLFLISFGFLLSLNTRAQDTSQVFIPLLAYWSLNDTFPYSVQEYKLSYRNDESLRDSIGRDYLLSLVVSDTTDSTYVIRLLKKFDFDEVREQMIRIGIPESEITLIEKELDAIILEYSIDNNGVFLEPLKVDVIQASVQKAVERLKQNSKYAKDPVLMEALLEMFARPEYTQIKYFDDLQTLHKFYGMEYALDSTWIFTDEVENPFNPKEVLNYQNEVLTTAPEDWNGLVRQQVYITIAEADARKLMMAALIDIAAESTIKDILDKYPPQIDIYISYVINPDWGVVYAMYYEKTVYLGGKINSKQVLNMEFEGGW